MLTSTLNIFQKENVKLDDIEIIGGGSRIPIIR
jgi:hypothetical protein